MKLWPDHYSPPFPRKLRDEIKPYRRDFMPVASTILGVSVWEIRAKNKKRRYVYRRFAIAHVMREILNYTYPQIAEAIGLDNHTSVIHAVQKSRVLVECDENHASMVNALEAAV